MSRSFTGSVAYPITLLVIAMISIQTGATIAKSLFPITGAPGATALRLLFAALILLIVFRPWRMMPQGRAWRSLILYGAALGGMNLLYYMALRTLPLGVAIALEFTGPLLVAILGSRRLLDFLWVILAIAGLLLLLPIGLGASDIDPVGAAYALGAGAFWAGYILFGKKAGGDHGANSVAWGTVFAALIIVPVGVVDAGAALFTPAAIPLALGVAVLSTAFPYSLEMVALTRMPARVFGTLMSIEPAIGAVSGLIILGERLATVQWAAIAAIVAASLGAALTIGEKTAPVPVAD
ncbi:threonine/homoserine exporter RhtA [Sphingobium boeckii]|uniref:Inner membrane transporter RhtA n=1 Tax=Sphingobium boeckii TaxID=1082345 RepID=A0A7W9AJN2_9SPHN|nr:threonine/homoserine exporter RhtA [Sphingobium boeckii]MBB5686932.1 inner membrane transporter RhtA [Sphingobium boeckii]